MNAGFADVLCETALRQAMFDDTVSSADDWHSIVTFCQDLNEGELALEILAAMTLNDVLRNASQNASDALKEAREQGLELPEHESQESARAAVKLQAPTLKVPAKTRFVGFDDDAEATSRSLVTQDTMTSRTGQSLEMSSTRSGGAGIADDESLDEA